MHIGRHTGIDDNSLFESFAQLQVRKKSQCKGHKCSEVWLTSTPKEIEVGPGVGPTMVDSTAWLGSCRRIWKGNFKESGFLLEPIKNAAH